MVSRPFGTPSRLGGTRRSSDIEPVTEVNDMRGPMDDAIPSEPAGGDKARRRLEEFVEQRYPGGLPPSSRPLEEASRKEPSRAAKPPAKRKRAKKRKR